MSKLLIAPAILISGALAVPVPVAAASKSNNKDYVQSNVIFREVGYSSSEIDKNLDDVDDSMNSTNSSNSNAEKPGDIIDLKNWYITLPTGSKGKPDTVKGSKLIDYSSQYMQLNDDRDGVVFTAHAGGSTTKNSQYPRSELREMDGSKMASWDGNSGQHTMEIRQAVTKLPVKKAEVVVGQIHGTSDDLMQIHLSGRKLTVKYDDGKKKVSLDDNYELGTIFTVKIESADGQVKVWYNDDLKAELPISSDTSYFKAGNYLQTNTSKGDSASASSEVVIYSLEVRHED